MKGKLLARWDCSYNLCKWMIHHRLGWYGVVGIYMFFLVSTVINKFLMGPIVSLIFQQERQEGNFRYNCLILFPGVDPVCLSIANRFHHVQVRANSEAVAFYQ